MPKDSAATRRIALDWIVCISTVFPIARCYKVRRFQRAIRRRDSAQPCRGICFADTRFVVVPHNTDSYVNERCRGHRGGDSGTRDDCYDLADTPRKTQSKPASEARPYHELWTTFNG